MVRPAVLSGQSGAWWPWSMVVALEIGSDAEAVCVMLPPVFVCDSELYWILAPKTMFWVKAERLALASAVAVTADEILSPTV